MAHECLNERKPEGRDRYNSRVLELPNKATQLKRGATGEAYEKHSPLSPNRLNSLVSLYETQVELRDGGGCNKRHRQSASSSLQALSVQG